MKKYKKRYLLYAFLLLIMIISSITNPTKSDYLTFCEEQHGLLVTPPGVEIERRKFFLFSTYASVTNLGHYGIVHLGFMGSFFQISKGQYDQPWWLNLLY